MRKPERVSLADSIADSIAEAIAVGTLQSGERMVETALAEQFAVSRVPVREALKVLHAQGILSGGGHRGYRVTAFSPDIAWQVLEVRLMLETILLRDAIVCWRAGEGDPAALNDAIEEMRRSARSGDVRASLLADIEFHRTIRRAAANPIVGTLWETITRHALIGLNFERYRIKDLAGIPRQHEDLRDMILAKIDKPGTQEDLANALEEHMRPMFERAASARSTAPAR
jgi:DNA-binding GntR family transcriptional regulator